MHIPGLLSLLLSSALASTPKADPPTPPRANATEIHVEVVESSGSKPSSFGFVVPVDGAITAWIDRGDDPRRCEVKADPHRELQRITLKCDGSRARMLEVEALRTLAPGKRTRIAAVTRPGGGTSQVFVTLQ